MNFSKAGNETGAIEYDLNKKTSNEGNRGLPNRGRTLKITRCGAGNPRKQEDGHHTKKQSPDRTLHY